MQNGAWVFDKRAPSVMSAHQRIYTAVATASILQSRNTRLCQRWSAAPSFEAAMIPGQFTRLNGRDMSLAIVRFGSFATGVEPAAGPARSRSSPIATEVVSR